MGKSEKTKKNIFWTTVIILSFILTNCSQSNNELAFKKGKPAFVLANGGTISTDEYDEYNPVLLKNQDGTLTLLFGSNRPCAASCSGHNLFMSVSTSAYSDFLGELPLFSEPEAVQVGGGLANAGDFLHFAATTNAGSSAQITLYVNDPSSGNIVTTTMTPGDPTAGSPTPIANTANISLKVAGIKSNGSEIMGFDDATGEVSIFDPTDSGDTYQPIDILFGANAAINVPEPAAGGIQDAWLGIIDGAMAAGSPQGIFGFAEDLALTLAEEGLFMVNAAGFYGGNDNSDFITFSAIDSFTGSEDIYGVTTHTIGDMWDMASFSFDFGGLAGPGGPGPGGITCPAGYIPVLPDPGAGTSSDFCVAKFEMKNSGGAISEPAGTPWVSITQTQAITECQNIGAGYHLITNEEWMTIAHSIEGNSVNWQSGIVGNGSLNRGHTDGTPSSALAASTDNDACSGTSDSCDDLTWHLQRRTHSLMNGEVIWDFAGNVNEWIDWTINLTADKAYVNIDGGPIDAWKELGLLDMFTAAMPASSILPLTPSLDAATHGIGRYYSGTATPPHVAYRSGGFTQGDIGGIYMLNVAIGNTSSNTNTGFRCAYTP